MSAQPKGSSDDWWTPRARFAQWHREFIFTVDAAASPENALLPRFFSLETNGLAQDWRGERVWCNCPYSEIAPWVEKAHRAHHVEGASLVALLLPAWTDRAWWLDYIEPFRDGRGPVETRFLPRLKFGWPGNPEGDGGDTPRFGSVLVVWRRGSRSLFEVG